MWDSMIILSCLLASLLYVYADTINNSYENDECKKISSCSTCISKSECSWCVTKSKCTKQFCGNDNVIYPQQISAIMSGPTFCPRIVEPEEILTIKSGSKEGIVVKITQIHLYMAFTPWKCKIEINGKESEVSALLLGDKVYCASVIIKNQSDKPHVDGKVTVLWDFRKSFDGLLPFKVCRCDLDPNCIACKK